MRSALLVGSALGAALAADMRAWADCVPGFTDGPDTASCSGTIAGDVDALAGDDDVSWTATLPDGDLRLGAGADTAGMTDGEIFGDVLGEGGDDTITLDGTVVHGIVSGGSGGDTILLLSGGADSVDGGDDADDITLDGAAIVGGIAGGSSGDLILLSSGMAADVTGDGGDDQITLAGAVVTGSIAGGDGADILTLSGGSAGGIDGGDGADRITLSGATVNGILAGGADGDVILLSSGVATDVDGGTGADAITLAGAVVADTLGGGAGDDTILLTSGSAAAVDGGADADRITLAGATVTAIGGGAGDDAITLSSGSADTVAGDEGDDEILLSGAVVGSIDGGAGADTVSVTLGSVGSMTGGADADTLLLDGGTITGTLAGGTGGDTITLRSGTVASVMGEEDGDSILLDGALVSGAIDGGAGDDAVEIRSGLVTAVTGGTGADRLLVTGGTVLGSLDAGEEDDTIDLRAGTVDGAVLGGDGDDTATVRGGFNVAAVESFDGGIGTDALRLAGLDGTLFMPIDNWERLVVGGGSDVTLGLSAYGFGSGPGQGLLVAGGSTLRFMAPATRIEGDVGVAGTIALRNLVPADTLLVAGDFTGAGGRVSFDTLAGGADRLLIVGDAGGRTILDLAPLGRAATGAPGGLSLVQVGGTASPGAFALDGGYVAGGLYQYRIAAYDPALSDDAALDPLLAGEGATDYWDFRLRNSGALVPQIAGYQALPPAVLSLGAATLETVGRPVSADQGTVWATVQGWDGDVTGEDGPDFDQRRWVFAAGVDPYRREDEEAGIVLYHARSTASAGDADIDLTGWGLAGRYALEAGRFRLGALVAATHWSAEIDTPQRGRVGTTDGWGFAASLEAGYALTLGDGLTLTPGAGLAWQHARLDGFEDPDAIAVDLGEIDSLRLRAGATLQKRWDAVAAHLELAFAQELLGGGTIDADGTGFETDGLGSTVMVGAGLSASLSPGLDLFVDTGLEHALSSGSNAVTGRIGARWSF